MKFSLGCLLIAGGIAVVLSVWREPPTTLAIAEAPAAHQPTAHSLSSPPPQAADKALVGTDVPPVSAPHPKIVAKDDPAPASITVPTNPTTKSTPSVPAVAEAPKAQLWDADQALFVQRGYQLLAAGDIASARQFFERAANAGDALSALEMAKTFDPGELTKAGVRGMKGDQAKADYWYQRARLLAGDRDLGDQVKENRHD